MNKNILINTEDIQSYIKDIKKIKVITHERQDVIFTELKKQFYKIIYPKLKNIYHILNIMY
jgi:hypothetical protein